MHTTTRKTRRVVRARRAVALGTVAVTALVAAAHGQPGAQGDAASSARVILAQSEGGEAAGEGVSAPAVGGGEGEGGGASLPAEIAFLTDLGFMTGHLRAGMALYEAGVLDEAKTHMGHPIEEKYDAVSDTLETRGFGGLRAQILGLSGAAEADSDPAEVRALFDSVLASVDEVRAASPGGVRDQLLSLSALTRIAGEEYAVGIAPDGSVANLHEYQDSWGFMRTVEVEAQRFSRSEEPEIATAGAAVLEQVRATDAAYGDLAGAGISAPDPSILYGAAARMELAAMGAR